MKPSSIVAFLATLVFSIGHYGCASSSQTDRSHAGDSYKRAVPGTSESTMYLDVSIIELIANPQAFHDKPVRVTGFMHVEFEGSAIYLHQEDYVRGLYNGIKLAFDHPDQLEDKDCNNDTYVQIEGVFDGEIPYQFFPTGILGQIGTCIPWPAQNPSAPE
jgi:hypothetical protein